MICCDNLSIPGTLFIHMLSLPSNASKGMTFPISGQNWQAQCQGDLCLGG